MTSEDRAKLGAADRAAQEARAVLEAPALVAALEAIEQSYEAGIRNSAPEEGAKREVLYHALRGLDRLRADLRHAVTAPEVMRKQPRYRAD